MGTRTIPKSIEMRSKINKTFLAFFRYLNQALIKEKGSKISCRNIKIEGQNVMIGYLSPSMLLFSLGLL